MGCVGWVVWVHGLCRLGGVGTWGSAVVCYVQVNVVGSTVSYYVCRDYMYMHMYSYRFERGGDFGSIQ